ADALVFVTSTPGVLRHLADPASRIPRMRRHEFEAAVAGGAVSGGMIPKLEESFAALEGGARSAVVVGKLAAGDLTRAVLGPGSAAAPPRPRCRSGSARRGSGPDRGGGVPRRASRGRRRQAAPRPRGSGGGRGPATPPPGGPRSEVRRRRGRSGPPGESRCAR